MENDDNLRISFGQYGPFKQLPYRGKKHLFYIPEGIMLISSLGHAWTLVKRSKSGSIECNDYASRQQAIEETERYSEMVETEGYRKLFQHNISQPLSEYIDIIANEGRLKAEFKTGFIDLIATRLHRGDRADLFRVDAGRGREPPACWISHKEGAVVREDSDRCQLIVTSAWASKHATGVLS